jgi:hypothetical protein
MGTLNRALTAAFDVLLWPLERLSAAWALVLASAAFGVLALFVFKHVSAQKRIRAVKDRMAAHLIEIRIWQDDLAIVARATGKVLLRNFQYLALNLLPFVPLSIPFALVLAQLVTRYAYAPLALSPPAGGAATLVVELARDARVEDLALRWPVGLEPVSPLVRAAGDGRAFQHFVARASGEHALVLELGASRETKLVAAGDARPRALQPERAQGFVHALLWPAEPSIASNSPFKSVAITYPERDLGWLPGGPGGIVLGFLIASMLGGALAIKPLRVAI